MKSRSVEFKGQENERVAKLTYPPFDKFDVIYKGRAVRIGMIPSDRAYTVSNDSGDLLEVPAGESLVLAIINANVKSSPGMGDYDRWDPSQNVFRVEDKKEGRN